MKKYEFEQVISMQFWILNQLSIFKVMNYIITSTLFLIVSLLVPYTRVRLDDIVWLGKTEDNTPGHIKSIKARWKCTSFNGTRKKCFIDQTNRSNKDPACFSANDCYGLIFCNLYEYVICQDYTCTCKSRYEDPTVLTRSLPQSSRICRIVDECYGFTYCHPYETVQCNQSLCSCKSRYENPEVLDMDLPKGVRICRTVRDCYGFTFCSYSELVGCNKSLCVCKKRYDRFGMRYHNDQRYCKKVSDCLWSTDCAHSEVFMCQKNRCGCKYKEKLRRLGADVL